jgi:DNA-binding CsgD family transcriptional regulator
VTARDRPTLGELPGDLTEAETQGVLAQLDSARQRRKEQEKYELQKRREEALAYRLAGMSDAQIAERMKIGIAGVRDMIERALRNRAGSVRVEEMRLLENARLDRAQAAIWPEVLAGNQDAVKLFLNISHARRRLNGMDAPLDIRLSVTVKQEMEHALAELEAVVMHQVVPGEVISSRDDGDDEGWA